MHFFNLAKHVKKTFHVQAEKSLLNVVYIFVYAICISLMSIIEIF